MTWLLSNRKRLSGIHDNPLIASKVLNLNPFPRKFTSLSDKIDRLLALH